MVEIEKRAVRKNGFNCPIHPTQLLTYFIYFGDLFTFYSIDMVSLSHHTALIIILSTVYFLLALGTLYYGYTCTKINPTDPTIELEQLCKDNRIHFDSRNYEYHCQICDSHVLAGSKHCG